MELGQAERLVHGGDMVLGHLDSLVHDPTLFPAEPWPRHPEFPHRARLPREPQDADAMEEDGITPEMVAQVQEALGR